MHNNYYFLRQLTPPLSNTLVGGVLVEIFSQNRNELILGFSLATPHHPSFYIKAHLESTFCCLQFPEAFHRAKKNSVDLFPEVAGATVLHLRQFENERSFSIQLQSEDGTVYELLFKMHGNRSNVVLFRQQQAITLFKSSLSRDFSLSLEELDRSLEVTQNAFKLANGAPSKLYPTLGKLPKYYLHERQYDTLSREQQWNTLQRMIQQLEHPSSFYLTLVENELHLSLLPLGEIQEQYQDPLAAINAFFLRYTKENRLLSLRKQLTQRLTKDSKQTESNLRRSQQRLQQLTTGLSYQQTADLIMANLHAIPPASSQVTLHDFYHQEDVTIKLNPKLSPQKSAESYYRKAKNQKIEVAELEKNIRRREERLLVLLTQLEEIEAIDSPRALQSYAEEHGLTTPSAASSAPLPYRHLLIEGFDVYIGKSAKSNDTLLRQQAQKDDLWLHAKDVSGSHVLIKQRGKQPFPTPVIEKAAQLAAYYSKRKSDSLAPVIYTPSKYVRKGKNMPAGAVRVEREEVILVEPTAPHDDLSQGAH